MITNAIRNANTEHEVLFLLTTYVEAARDSGRLHFLSECVTELPLHGVPEVRARLLNLLLELDAASRNLDDYTRDVLHEAVYIFGTALEQLLVFEHRHALLAA
jgi:hypothetical protein